MPTKLLGETQDTAMLSMVMPWDRAMQVNKAVTNMVMREDTVMFTEVMQLERMTLNKVMVLRTVMILVRVMLLYKVMQDTMMLMDRKTHLISQVMQVNAEMLNRVRSSGEMLVNKVMLKGSMMLERKMPEGRVMLWVVLVHKSTVTMLLMLVNRVKFNALRLKKRILHLSRVRLVNAVMLLSKVMQLDRAMLMDRLMLDTVRLVSTEMWMDRDM